MITLELSKPYLSIQDFEKTSIGDFSIVTGINGSGKSHLLQAILKDFIQVKHIRPEEIVYFDYNSFQANSGSIQDQRDKILSDYRNKITVFKSKIKDEYTNSDIEFTLSQIAINSGTSSFQETIGTIDDFSLYKDQKNAGLKQWNNRNPKSYSTSFNRFINRLIGSSPSVLPDLEYETCEDLFLKISKQLEVQLIQSDKDYFSFLRNHIPAERTLFLLDKSDFNQASILFNEIVNSVSQYVQLQAKNDLNRLRSERGDTVKYLSNDEFVQKHGKHPLTEINEVLDQYDCNGYKLTDSGYYPTPFNENNAINRQQSKPSIRLVHETGEYTTDLSALSSGEKTLLALSLMITRANQQGIPPRLLLLDEIDTALHPSLAKRVIEILEKIFFHEKGIKIILVTHSPSTVALFPNESIYLVERKENFQLINIDQRTAINKLTEGFMSLERSMMLVDQISKDEILIFTEGNNVDYLKKANIFFGNNNIKVVEQIQDITCKNKLRTLFNFFSRLHHDTLIFFVWDCDVNFNLDPENNTFPYILPKNTQNSKVISGIENMFKENLFDASDYKRKAKADGGFHTSLDKEEFKNKILRRSNKNDFINFKPLFEFILGHQADKLT